MLPCVILLQKKKKNIEIEVWFEKQQKWQNIVKKYLRRNGGKLYFTEEFKSVGFHHRSHSWSLFHFTWNNMNLMSLSHLLQIKPMWLFFPFIHLFYFKIDNIGKIFLIWKTWFQTEQYIKHYFSKTIMLSQKLLHLKAFSKPLLMQIITAAHII